MIRPAIWAGILMAFPFLYSPTNAERFAVHNHRIFLPALLNGCRTDALLDSAAEASLVDPDFARAAGLPGGEPITVRGSGGTATAKVVEGVEVHALGITLHPDPLVITDLKDISHRLARRHVDMVLGRELFDAARLRIDMRTRTIEVVGDPSLPRGVELALTRHAGVEAIPVKANGVEAQAEFDLGNGSGVLISKPFAARLQLKPIGFTIGGGIGGAHRLTLVLIDRLVVAGRTFRHVRAAIDEQPSANDLNIGTKILLNFLITTDFAHRRVWLAD